ncbi:MAG: TRAP transporter large permease subunit [Dehalococcoidia bacterium]|nr:TRAP transporter large permease subunit [Dehalococcoidia bacterium]
MPVAFSIGAVAVIFTIAFWGIDHLPILAIASFTTLQNTNLVAIPLFILMGWIINESGIANDLFKAMYAWLGNVRGGLAMGTVLLSAFWGAICGDLIASIFTLTTVALPPLMKRGYDKRLAVGCIISGGLLAFLIPPSVGMITFCSVTGLSVGTMYLDSFIPGFLLAALYMIYIGIRCGFKPELGPPAPPEAGINWSVRFSTLKGVIAPLFLLLAMLIGIYSGAVTPMEASAVGVTGALICSALKKRLEWKMLWQSTFMTLRFTCMLGWMFIGVGCFTAVYAGIGAADLARSLAMAVPGGGIVVVIIMQLILLLAGMLMDATAITLILGPIFINVVKTLGFDPYVFGVLFMITMQTANISPPYGFGLFYIRSVIKGLPEDYNISMTDVMLGALPFAGIQILCLALILIFPRLVTILPDLIG